MCVFFYISQTKLIQNIRKVIFIVNNNSFLKLGYFIKLEVIFVRWVINSLIFQNFSYFQSLFEAQFLLLTKVFPFKNGYFQIFFLITLSCEGRIFIRSGCLKSYPSFEYI